MNQVVLKKGEQMEEKLRGYFLSLGYFVVRSAKLKYLDEEITDIDLFLYGRSSSLMRQRINVDIKNKKDARPFERALWATGVRALLSFDQCVIASSDKRQALQAFGREHGLTIFDGSFLDKLKPEHLNTRLSEEEFLNILREWEDATRPALRGWNHVYEESKSRLLAEQDYAGVNRTLEVAKAYFEIFISDYQRRPAALRMLYIHIAHLLLTLDFILKDVSYLDPSERFRELDEGLRYGNLGRTGYKNVLSMARIIAGQPAGVNLAGESESRTTILSDYFTRTEATRFAFAWAKDFEARAFARALPLPDELPSELKGILGLFLDYYGLRRKPFFGEKSTEFESEKLPQINLKTEVQAELQLTIVKTDS